nr:14 kDa phosphohistidine phosphatase isoform X1 [Pogona vitticeps]
MNTAIPPPYYHGVPLARNALPRSHCAASAHWGILGFVVPPALCGSDAWRLICTADIYDKVEEELEKQGLRCRCLGGGRISHQSTAKKLHIYGYSVGFGQAKHSISTEKLKTRYPDYEVTWSDEGY